MNYPEFHSHKWAKTFAKAKTLLEQANALYQQGQVDEAKQSLDKLYNGDFANENDIFPGLKISGPYWRGVDGEMNLRFDVLYEYSGWPELVDLPEFKNSVDHYYRLFLDDVKSIVETRNLLPYSKLEPFTDSYQTLKLGDGWVEIYNTLCAKTESALELGLMSPELLDEWFVYFLRGIIGYDHGLILQGVFSRMVIQNRGFETLVKVVAASAEDFGWRVSRLFFAKIYPEAGIDGMVLRQLGRYGMFADQDIETAEIRPPEDDEETPAYKSTIFRNCEERGIFERISADSGIPLGKLGVGICIHCAEHAKKNTEIFVPPDKRPVLRMARSLGLGDESCLFETITYPEPDMERFMIAQEQVFYTDTE